MDEMDRLADLGTALYPSEGPSAHLRVKALAIDTQSTTRSNRVRPLLITGGVAVLAAAAVVTGTAVTATGPGTGGGGPTTANTVEMEHAAFTVSTNADGSITFTARDLVNTGAAVRALSQAGIASRVINYKMVDGVAQPRTDSACGMLEPNDLDRSRPGRKAQLDWAGNSNAITVRSSDYPPGGGLLLAVIAAAQKVDGRVAVVVMVWPYKDISKIPGCVTLPRPATSASPSARPS